GSCTRERSAWTAFRSGPPADPDGRRSERASRLDERDALCGEAFAAAGKAEPVRRRRTHGDGRADEVAQDPLHLRAPIRDARLFSDQDAVGIQDGKAGAADAFERVSKQ